MKIQQRWTTVVAWSLISISTLVLMFAALVAYDDMSKHDDFLDGLGAAIALAAAIPVAINVVIWLTFVRTRSIGSWTAGCAVVLALTGGFLITNIQGATIEDFRRLSTAGVGVLLALLAICAASLAAIVWAHRQNDTAS
mgnify:CR=1 FL=1